MAAIIRKAPMPEIKVNVSFKKIEEMAKATNTSARRMMVEFTADMYFKPSDQR
jgi:hypothetical protein